MPVRNIYFIRATDTVGGRRQARVLAHKRFFQHMFVLSFRSAVQRLPNMPYVFVEVFMSLELILLTCTSIFQVLKKFKV